MSEHKGISVLIPVYNVDVRELVHDLYKQGHEAEIPFEIICFDDFSTDSIKKNINKEITNFPKVTYRELPFNLGRSKIRNELAKTASYSHLLFLDCDSSIPSSLFFENYFLHINHPLVIGGRDYHEEFPKQEFILHWTVGRAREQKVAEERNKNPYLSFMSNNFLIKKKVFMNIQLDEQLIGYGHEDTKFGYQLGKLKVPILHIDNPVIHKELDQSIIFLNKTKEGVKNFYKISQEGYLRDTKLYKTFSLLQRTGTIRLYLYTYSIFKNRIEKNLLSTTPSQFYFDLFKLYYLLIECQKSKF